MAGLLYGSEVHGVSGSELLSLQMVVDRTLQPTCGGRSLTAALLLGDDPTWMGCCVAGHPVEPGSLAGPML